MIPPRDMSIEDADHKVARVTNVARTESGSSFPALRIADEQGVYRVISGRWDEAQMAVSDASGDVLTRFQPVRQGVSVTAAYASELCA